MVLQDGFCNKCCEKYTDIIRKRCIPCQIGNLITNWTSGDKKIDSFIQTMQLKIRSLRDIVFEWISYDQFSDIKETRKGTAYLAIWKDGPLTYSKYNRNYIKSSPNENVALKCLHNSQIITDEFLNEV